jgi:hypothetical protein
MLRSPDLKQRPQSYAALIRSAPWLPRIHTRPERYYGHEPTRLAHQRNTHVKLVEPPSCSPASSIVFIGRNSRGQWVAQEQNGLYGGLFVNRAQAVKYALFENGHQLETIVELPREIELQIGGKLTSSAADRRAA